MARTYNQDCVLAYSFDLLGERWTFLIIRELFLGPRRFGDLHAALPGIGTNLLSKRLKELEEADIVEAAGDGRAQYRLTQNGEKLRPTLRELMYWAIEYFMHRPEPCEPKECIFSNNLVPDSTVLAAELFVTKAGVPHANYVLQLTVDDTPYTLYYMNREIIARRGGDTPAVARIATDVATLMQVMRGEISFDESRNRSKLSGDMTAIDHFLTSLAPGAKDANEVSELIRQKKIEAAAAKNLRKSPAMA